ncbi:Pfs, NACHT and Akyrin domain protein [Metarhizium acridum CQMa 102]|uniref:Pfs, NACHT and Akyrin domain protein n=1 Tax=Metarhizium acridum (strain CQMa 102) TaxID=655827 RepID=E9ED05_METAQ|nr:Pfs, NACHT and Akyrin domain protein [Metarhizium acridum CQMa 102]EFY86230.1 Pfs, NACHT and Akyrin domain protein [Metarhizium acridum CQMa 102]
MVVTQMMITFPNFQYGLLAGIGGGVPSETDSGKLRLGDVVASKPIYPYHGVVQYDRGRAEQDRFSRTGTISPISPPSQVLQNSVRELAWQRETWANDPVWKGAQRPRRSCRNSQRFKFPRIENDYLHHPDYTHRQPGKSCDDCGCNPEKRIPRHADEREESLVVVHYGIIASGEKVIKNAVLRDVLAEELGASVAGALFQFSFPVIRGISDHCDSNRGQPVARLCRWGGGRLYEAAILLDAQGGDAGTGKAKPPRWPKARINSQALYHKAITTMRRVGRCRTRLKGKKARFCLDALYSAVIVATIRIIALEEGFKGPSQDLEAHAPVDLRPRFCNYSLQLHTAPPDSSSQ